MGFFGVRVRWAILLGLIVLVATASCGGEGNAPAPSPPKADEDTFCFELAGAACGWARKCCELTELRQILGLDPSDPYSVDLVRRAESDPAVCQDLLHASCVSNQRDLLESIRTKRVTLDRTRFAECTKEYTRASTACDIGTARGPTLTNACDLSEIFTGNNQANDPCFHELDCAPGLFCWRAGGNSGAGICRTVVAQGQQCRESTLCEDTSVCVPIDTRTSKCAPLDRQENGTFCTADELCLPESFCNTLEFLCEPKRAGGEECNGSEHCLSARCNLDQRTCEPQGDRGARCSSHQQCNDGLWCNPLYAASYCTQPLETGDAGDSCDTARPCKEGLVCAGSVCQAPLPPSELCFSDAQCDDASYCDDTTDRCTSPRKQPGETCLNSRECAADLYCGVTNVTVTQSCLPRLALGEACVAGQDSCAVGARCNPTTAVCEPVLALGDQCVRAGDCQAGLVCEFFSGSCDGRIASGAFCDESAACPTAEYCSPPGARICQPPLTVGQGEGCTSGSVTCATGLYCASDAVCRPLGGPGATCTSTTQCTQDLYCNTLTLTCTAYGQQNAACSTYNLCAEGLYCSLSTCRAYTTTVGQICSTSSSGTDPMCGPGLQCQYDSTSLTYKCVALPGVGGACSSTNGCAAGLYCSFTTYTCQAPGQAGAACTATSQCATTLSCDLSAGTPGTCTAPRGVGQECTSTGQCEGGLTCHSYVGTCAARTALDGSCLRDEQCVDGSECLLESTCEPRAQLDEECDDEHPCAAGLRCDSEWGVCQPLEDPPLASGERCHVDDDCLSGSCVDNICTGLCQGVGG